jgi:dihydroxyacetone kinase-like protein
MTKLKDAFDAVATSIIQQKDYLTRLDEIIGDGDHGINMARGFEAAQEALEDMSDTSQPGPFLHAVGEAFLENVGGAAGPLYGTGFLCAAKVCEKDMAFNAATMDKLLAAAINGIQKRGHSQKGEKTMLDVLIPISDCFKPENADGLNLYQCLAAANRAANDGVAYTKTIVATKGRASYVGERSIGHEDPGAVSSMLMFRALYNFLAR